MTVSDQSVSRRKKAALSGGEFEFEFTAAVDGDFRECEGEGGEVSEVGGFFDADGELRIGGQN